MEKIFKVCLDFNLESPYLNLDLAQTTGLPINPPPLSGKIGTPPPCHARLEHPPPPTGKIGISPPPEI